MLISLIWYVLLFGGVFLFYKITPKVVKFCDKKLATGNESDFNDAWMGGLSHILYSLFWLIGLVAWGFNQPSLIFMSPVTLVALWAILIVSIILLRRKRVWFREVIIDKPSRIRENVEALLWGVVYFFAIGLLIATVDYFTPIL